MEDIFKTETVELLNETFGVSMDEIHRIQYKTLHDGVIARLSEILKLMKGSEYSKVIELTQNSPAGDGYGRDNRFIDFSHIYDPYRENALDIAEACEMLMELKKIKDGNQK